jgi:hypothetical protein
VWRLVYKAVPKIIALSALMMGIKAAPAFAQDYEAIRSILNGSDFAPKEKSAIVFVHKFGMCLAASWRPDVLSLLPKSKKSKDELFDEALIDSGCASFEDRVKYSPTFYRGPVAEYYLAWIQSGKKIPKGMLDIYTDPAPEERAKLKPEIRIALALVDVGSCVDQANHDATMKLFRTEPESAEESQVLASLTSDLADCIPPGVQLTFAKFILRGFLAEGAFRNAARNISTRN